MKTPLLIVLALLLAVVATVSLLWAPAAEEVPATSLTPEERGRQLALTSGCLACHSLDAAPGIGPSWHASFGAMRAFTDGSSAVVDEAYLRESIVQPAARIVSGYQNVMLPAALTDAQIADIIALIKDLTPTMPP